MACAGSRSDLPGVRSDLQGGFPSDLLRQPLTSPMLLTSLMQQRDLWADWRTESSRKHCTGRGAPTKHCAAVGAEGVHRARPRPSSASSSPARPTSEEGSPQVVACACLWILRRMSRHVNPPCCVLLTRSVELLAGKRRRVRERLPRVELQSRGQRHERRQPARSLVHKSQPGASGGRGRGGKGEGEVEGRARGLGHG